MSFDTRVVELESLAVPASDEIVVLAFASKSHHALDRYPAWRQATAEESLIEARQSDVRELEDKLTSIHHATCTWLVPCRMEFGDATGILAVVLHGSLRARSDRALGDDYTVTQLKKGLRFVRPLERLPLGVAQMTADAVTAPVRHAARVGLMVATKFDPFSSEEEQTAVSAAASAERNF